MTRKNRLIGYRYLERVLAEQENTQQKEAVQRCHVAHGPGDASEAWPFYSDAFDPSTEAPQLPNEEA